MVAKELCLYSQLCNLGHHSKSIFVHSKNLVLHYVKIFIPWYSKQCILFTTCTVLFLLCEMSLHILFRLYDSLIHVYQQLQMLWTQDLVSDLFSPVMQWSVVPGEEGKKLL